MSGVPRAIDLNRIGNRFVFVQSGNKSGNEKPAVHFGRKHFDFLKELYRNTKIVKKFVDSQYYKTLDDLQNYKKHFGITQWDIIQKSIDKVASFFIVTTEFYLYHGDFTAWNMYMKEGRLWVFDFEYAKTEYPPYLDLFHFHTQLWFFVQHKDSDQIWEEYQKRRQKWVKYLNIDSLEIFYMAYLLDMIHENIKLEEKADKKIDTKCYGLWVHLLEKCLIHYRH